MGHHHVYLAKSTLPGALNYTGSRLQRVRLLRAPGYNEQFSLHQILSIDCNAKKSLVTTSKFTRYPIYNEQKEAIARSKWGNFTLCEHLISNYLLLSHMACG